MKVIKIGGQFFSYPEAVKTISREIGQSNGMVLFVISAVKEVTRILTMLNLVNSSNNIPTEFKRKQYSFLYGLIENIHLDLINKLFEGECKKNIIAETIAEFYVLFESLKIIVEEMEGHNAFHRIVQYGELISSMIYHRYLGAILFENILIHAPDYVVTNPCKEGQEEIERIKPEILDYFEKGPKLFLIQGFIGKDFRGYPTTLGDNGSDYSAAKLAEFINRDVKVTEVIFAKDVLGVYESDPKKDPFAQIKKKINLSDYKAISQENYVVRIDAVETLVECKIPTIVRSFLDWRNPGTKIVKR